MTEGQLFMNLCKPIRLVAVMLDPLALTLAPYLGRRPLFAKLG